MIRIGKEREKWSSREHMKGLALVWTDRVVDDGSESEDDDEVSRVHATMVDVEGCPRERMSIEIVIGSRYPYKPPAFVVSDEQNTEAAFRAVSNTIKDMVSHWSPAITVELILEKIYADMLSIHRHRAARRADEVARVEWEQGQGSGWRVYEPPLEPDSLPL